MTFMEIQTAYTQAEQYTIAICSIPGIGPTRYYQMLNEFGDVITLWHEAPLYPERLNFLGAMMRGRVLNSMNDAFLQQCLYNLKEAKVHALPVISNRYPPMLKTLFHPPPLLYARGNERFLHNEKAIAVVGTRNCTPYGREVAEKLSQALSAHGVTVVSGLARGIDSMAHVGALKDRGSTVGVLGCGIDRVYPEENATLYSEVYEKGCIISEYPMGVEPNARYFPARNRIISGMSVATAVVESGAKSGAHITVEFALEQGRDVFAVPGGIFSRSSVGTNRLIQDGAQILLNEFDILEAYGWDRRNKNTIKADIMERQMQMQEAKQIPENAEEGCILRCLQNRVCSFDELAQNSMLDTPTLNSTLTILELRGIIKQLPGQMYTL